MSVTYYKGFVGREDIEFGIGTFTRKDKNHTSRDLTQVNLSHIPRKVIAKDADFIILGTYIGEYTFTNTGAAGTITISLPVALAGLGPYNFLVADAQQLNIDPNGTEYFRDCAAGKYKYSTTQGNRLKVWCDINGIWEWDFSGVWNNEA